MLSVHNGVLDFHLRNVDGKPAGANPSPVINATSASQYQSYCRYAARFRVDNTKWHTFTQEWAPGVRRYYLDDQLIGTSTRSVFAGPQRWQLRTETDGNGTHSGHLLVDWVAVYAYQP